MEQDKKSIYFMIIIGFKHKNAYFIQNKLNK